MRNKLYPLKFQPIFKQKVWGGEKLNTLLDKNTKSTKTGESWEISAIANSVSLITNGELAGRNLISVLEEFKGELVGEKVYQHYGNKFPLLFKFIDAGQNLSLQLHPDDTLAQERHNSFGKTEMWYILQADENAGIYVGFKKGTTQAKYLEHLNSGKLEEIINFEKVTPGDVYYIRPGLVHSIGKGVFLAEIQQSSDVTYRLFDWNREDLDGKPRKLHTELAINAIDFDSDDYRIPYNPKNHNFQSLVANEFFKTRILNLNKELSVDYSQTDSFVVLMCVKGEVQVKTTTLNVQLIQGESLLIPACLNQVVFQSSQAELLEVTI